MNCASGLSCTKVLADTVNTSQTTISLYLLSHIILVATESVDTLSTRRGNSIWTLDLPPSRRTSSHWDSEEVQKVTIFIIRYSNICLLVFFLLFIRKCWTKVVYILKHKKFKDKPYVTKCSDGHLKIQLVTFWNIST